MKQLAVINPKNISESEANSYPLRFASRAVVTDSKGRVALLYVAKLQYYKLPGGGIEKNEDKIDALVRECREEIGCEIEVIQEVGSILEYREIFKIRQLSYCYLAKLKGEKGEPKFTDEEKSLGFNSLWLPYDEVIKKQAENKTYDVEGKDYIVPRDLIFLSAVKT